MMSKYEAVKIAASFLQCARESLELDETEGIEIGVKEVEALTLIVFDAAIEELAKDAQEIDPKPNDDQRHT